MCMNWWLCTCHQQKPSSMINVGMLTHLLPLKKTFWISYINREDRMVTSYSVIFFTPWILLHWIATQFYHPVRGKQDHQTPWLMCWKWAQSSSMLSPPQKKGHIHNLVQAKQHWKWSLQYCQLNFKNQVLYILYFHHISWFHLHKHTMQLSCPALFFFSPSNFNC